MSTRMRSRNAREALVEENPLGSPLTVPRHVLLGLLLVVGLSACKCGPQPYNLELSLDGSWAGTEEEWFMVVDALVLTESEYKRWGFGTLSVDDYFNREAAAFRTRERFKGMRKTATFSHEKRDPVILSKDEEADFWSKRLQQRAERLVIMAHVPFWEQSPGDDRRRLELPLDRDFWEEDTIKVEIGLQGVELITVPLKGIEETSE